MNLIRTWRFLTLMLASCSLGLSLAHLLEMPRRIQFDRQLWVQVTVFENLYQFFGTIGAFFEVGSLVLAIGLLFIVRERGLSFYWTLGGTVFLVLALLSWILLIAPMNAEFTRWLTEPVPVNWTRYRDQWEYTHAINAFLKMIGFGLLVASVLSETPEKKKVAYIHR